MKLPGFKLNKQSGALYTAKDIGMRLGNQAVKAEQAAKVTPVAVPNKVQQVKTLLEQLAHRARGAGNKVQTVAKENPGKSLAATGVGALGIGGLAIAKDNKQPKVTDATNKAPVSYEKHSAYGQGFISKCNEKGVDYVELINQASKNSK